MRAVIVVLDGVGLGEAPDAAQYGDTGSNTLANTAKAVGGLHLPNMERMGLGNLARECGVEIAGVRPTARPEASYARMHPASAGKDTTTGHWELAGVKLDQPFPTYPRGFPTEIIQEFEAAIGRRVLGNYPASGTEIIQKLGDEHVRTGRPIVYTSADSVFQIAAHEEVIPLQELYAMCQTARRILKPPHGVGRVIARPFIGTSGNYVRTGARRDFSLEPPGPTLLDVVSAAGMDVMACGKIDDIFAGKGITRSSHVAGNDAVFDAMLDFLRATTACLRQPGGSTKWGHGDLRPAAWPGHSTRAGSWTWGGDSWPSAPATTPDPSTDLRRHPAICREAGPSKPPASGARRMFSGCQHPISWASVELRPGFMGMVPWRPAYVNQWGSKP